DVEPLRLIGVYSDPANHQIVTYPDGNVIHYVSSVFECAVRGGTLTCCEESLELAFFSPDALPPDTLPISRIRIVDALTRRVEAFVRGCWRRWWCWRGGWGRRARTGSSSWAATPSGP